MVDFGIDFRVETDGFLLRFERKQIRKALGAGAKIVARAARKKLRLRRGVAAPAGAPSARQSGLLARSIRSRVGRRRLVARVGVLASKGGPFYGRFLETSTRNIAARPFLRPAMDENKSAVSAAINRAMRKAIEPRSVR